MKHSNRLDYWGNRLPGFEEPNTNKKKLYAESSRQSVRDTMEQWRKVAAERRLMHRHRDDTSVTNSVAPAVKRQPAPDRHRPTRRSSSATPRESMMAENLGPVVVTHYAQSNRNSMDATQIQTDQGTPLRFHAPVRGSVQRESELRESIRQTSTTAETATTTVAENPA